MTVWADDAMSVQNGVLGFHEVAEKMGKPLYLEILDVRTRELDIRKIEPFSAVNVTAMQGLAVVAMPFAGVAMELMDLAPRLAA